MTMTGHDCQASKAADPNLCLWVKISIFPLRWSYTKKIVFRLVHVKL